jgi:ABC-2 type transport system permease protein
MCAGDTGMILMLAATHVFSGVFISLGLVAGNAKAAHGMSSLIVVPLAFVSSVYVPDVSMPGWMQSFASNQPITVIINAARPDARRNTVAGIEHSTAHWVTLSLLWCAGILIVFGAIAVGRVARRR